MDDTNERQVRRGLGITYCSLDKYKTLNRSLNAYKQNSITLSNPVTTMQDTVTILAAPSDAGHETY